MKLIEAVNAYMAANEMSRQSWPYAMSYAIVKVKTATRDALSFFVDSERALIEGYAALDDHGNIRLAQGGGFIFKDISNARAYEDARRALCETEIEHPASLVQIKAPVEIKPAHIEALAGFIQFTTEEGS